MHIIPRLSTRLAAAALVGARSSGAQPVSGDVSARFTNPSAPCVPPVTCTGVGTATFDWGEPLDASNTSNLLRFSSFGAFAATPGVPFGIGTVHYRNGTTVIGSTSHTVQLSFDFTFVGASSYTLETFLTLISTPNVNVDPAANADYVTFESPGFNASFHVLEESAADVDLVVRLVPSGVTPLAAPAGFGIQSAGWSVQLVALANPTTGGYVTTGTVPEPASVALLAPPLLALAGWGARRRRG